MERIDNNVAIRHNPRPIVLQEELITAELQRKLSHREMNTLNYMKAICYQYKTKIQDLENLFPRINNGDVEITPEIDDIAATTNIPENTVIERPCRVRLVKEADTLIIPCRHLRTCYQCTR